MVKDEGKQAAGAEPRRAVPCLLNDIRQSSLLEEHHSVDSDVLSLGSFSNEPSPRPNSSQPTRPSPGSPLASRCEDALSRLNSEPAPVLQHGGQQAMLRAVAKVHRESHGLFLVPRSGEPGDDFLVRRFHEQRHPPRSPVPRNGITVSSKPCSAF
jgi:hypothetical protein